MLVWIKIDTFSQSLIDCIRFYSSLELEVLWSCVFRGLVDLVASIDTIMQEHLERATVFKGASKNRSERVTGLHA